MEKDPITVKDSLVSFKTIHGDEQRGALDRLSRYAAVFKIHDTAAVFRTSETLKEFRIIFQERTVYSGRAVIRSQINDGLGTICEVTLDESSWADMDVTLEMIRGGRLQEQFASFIREWQKLYRVLPEYKLIVADLQSFLSDLHLSLDQIELGFRALPPQQQAELEQEIAHQLGKSAAPMFDFLFERFEEVVKTIDAHAIPAHQTYARRQLHPLVSSSPFFYRCYSKPLGYAGDYEMVNMMLRNPCEGPTLFAKVLNLWFLDQPPVVAHRNRIDYLVGQLVQFAVRMANRKRPARIISIGCGPAQEVQRFVERYPISNEASITLLDFNEETLRNTGAIMAELKSKHQRKTDFHYIKKSVHHLLKEGGRTVEIPGDAQYDLVYCAGLFDYLTHQVCHRLMDIMYEWVSPGGMLIATNVAAHNPSRGWMEHVTDWHLIYRDARQMAELAPKKAAAESSRVLAEQSGVNIFVEVEKPAHA